jgi:hypothetical protein
MKKRLYHMFSFIFIISSSILLTNAFWQWFELWNTSTILSTDVNEVLNTDNWNATISDPLREWAYQMVNADDNNTGHQIWWIINNDVAITEHDVALETTLDIIKNIINYALWLLSLVALIYLIIHGFMIVTAAWDDTRYKQWLAWIKTAIIAIGGIWLSRFIISFIFWIIINITNTDTPTPQSVEMSQDFTMVN